MLRINPLFLFLFAVISAHSQDIWNKKTSPRPNIVIMMADDLDVQQLSSYGGQNLVTPHIDGLAESGTRFTHMVASEAMCIPVRASLFTGLYPARHGAHQNHKTVYDTVKSIVPYLKEIGYRVGLTGKDHMTKPRNIFPFNIVPGFESNCVADTDEYFLDSVETYITKEEPFCLFVMNVNPHAPWTVGDPTEFDPEKLVLPSALVDTEATRSQFTKYLAEVRRLDNQIGEVIDLLKKTGQYDNTLVIFLGEQGPQFPGGKWTLWDYGQRSAMIVRWPEYVKKGVTTDALVQYEDILPTLLEIVGGVPPKDIDGQSFIHVLKDHTKAHRKYAYGIHNNIPEGNPYPMRSIRDERYKLIVNLLHETDYYIKYMMNPAHKASLYNDWLSEAKTKEIAQKIVQRLVKRPPIEFYDLSVDPDELDNRIHDSKYQEHIKRLLKELEIWMIQQGDLGVAMDVPLTKETNYPY